MKKRSNFDEVQRHVVKAIVNADVIADPYPHVVIDNYFPDKFYADVLANFPKKESMTSPFNEVRTYNNIWQLDIVADPFVKGSANNAWSYLNADLDPSTFALCETIYALFRSKEVVEAWRKKFALDADLNLFQVGRLAIDGFDAGLGPHVDRDDKIISNVLYLSEGNEPKQDCGTHLLRKKPEADHIGTVNHDHQTYDYFEVVKTVEYVPNRLIGWRVVPNSWHSYHQLFDGDRKTIKFFVQEKLDGYSELQERRRRGKETSQDWRKGKISSSSVKAGGL